MAAAVAPAATSGEKPGNLGTRYLSRHEQIELLVRLVRGKGSAGVASIEQKIRAGQVLSAKGITWDVGMLREALAKVKNGEATGKLGHQPVPQSMPIATPVRAPAPAPSPAPASARVAAVSPSKTTVQTSTSTPTPAVSSTASHRWAVAPPTAASLVRKAQMESETAEHFICKAKNVGENKVAVLTKPSSLSNPTGEYVLPGEVFDVVSRCARPQDGRTYLRLRSSTGWVCTRSRKDFARIVLCGAEDGRSLEPAGFGGTPESPAMGLLHHEEPKTGTKGGGRTPQSFRVLGSRPVPLLGLPSLDASMPGALLQGREEFVADSVSLVVADGRAYLHLADGRGWVSERLRSDFLRLAVEPTLGRGDLDLPRPRRTTTAPAAPTAAALLGQPQRRREASVQIRQDPPCATTTYEAPQRGPSLKEEAVVLRSDASLWPAKMSPRPLQAELRLRLRRLANCYAEGLQECSHDLREVEGRAEAYARSCDGKKQLTAHAEALRREHAKIEKEWEAAVQGLLAGDTPPPAPDVACEAGTRPAAVIPVQVLGQPWHCAVLRGSCAEASDGGGVGGRRLGPLRPSAEAAAEDLRRLTGAADTSAAGKARSDGPAAKRPRLTSKTHPTGDAEADAEEEGD